MIPDPWGAVVLALAAFRLTRLVGWDDWPPIYRARAWIIGEHWTWEHNIEIAPELAGAGEPTEPQQPVYDRPLLAHLVHCAFCLGWWVSLAVYLAWLAAPTAALYVAAPFALSSAVGLIAKNLDA